MHYLNISILVDQCQQEKEEQETSWKQKMEEMETRQGAATNMVRSVKAELVRTERRLKEAEEEVASSSSLTRRQTTRLAELESMLTKKDRESETLRRKAKASRGL